MLKNIFIYLLGLTLMFSSCERDETITGPKYKSAPSDLRVNDDNLLIVRGVNGLFPVSSISFSNPLIEDYVADSLYFKASFNHDVTWVITIEGTESKAKKTIIGNGDTTANAFWTGESENIYFFKADETLKITLSFLGNELKIEKMIGLIKPKLFPGVFLISDFELGDNIQGIVKGAQGDKDGWFDYFDVDGEDEEISRGIGPAFGVDNITVKQPSKASVPVESIQGGGYYHLRGDDNAVKPSPFFIGGFGHDAITYKLPDVDASTVYMNFYANSNGNNTTKLIVELAGVGGDLFTKEINVDWDGWQLVSIRLSDFSLTTAGDIGTGSLVIPQLKQMKFAIHSSGVAGNTAEINIDYVTFTIGKPFRQQ